MKLQDYVCMLLRLCSLSCLLLATLPSPGLCRKDKASMWWNLALMDDWSLSSPSSITSSLGRIPHYSQAFTKRQQHLLEKNVGALTQVVQAARLAVAECKRQMSWRRWNCSTNPSLHPGRSIFGGIVKKGYKETSFLHALSSATLAYSVARACSEGLLKTCSCDTQQPPYHPSLHLRSKKLRWINAKNKMRKEGLKRKRKKHISSHQRARKRVRKISEKSAKERSTGMEGRRKRRKHGVSKKHYPRRPVLTRSSHLGRPSHLGRSSHLGRPSHLGRSSHLRRPSHLARETKGSLHHKALFIDHSDMTTNVVKRWQWGGCNDNLGFGYRFSRKFIDSSEQDRDLKCAVNKHNNEAGRQHVIMNAKPVCKCHGLSGSCSVKTCWIRLVPFWFIGHDIKLRLDGASKVNHGNDILKASKIKLQPVQAYQKPPSKRDLVYYEESPRFCDPNPALSHPGVQGKECKKSSNSLDACDVMCCGRGWRSETFEETHQCDCTFNYCCTVVCKQCVTSRTRSFCL